MTTLGAPFQVSHASGLRALNRVLASMHADMLRAGSVQDGTVRLPVLNIVAVCMDEPSADLAAQAVGRLGARHPARAIIVVAKPASATHIEADVSLQCSAVDRGQVCAEQVRLSVGGDAAFHLASVVTPLLVHDIPVYLWLIGSPPLEQAFGQDAIAVSERLILDSGAYRDTAATLGLLAAQLRSAGDAISLADIAWERARVWRLVIARCFDGQQMRGLVRGVTSVSVECGTAAVSAQSRLLAGWLESRLHREGDLPWPGVVVTAALSDGAPDHELVRVSLQCAARGHQALVTVERRGGVLHSVIDIDGGVSAATATPLADLDDVDLVGQLLESASEDPIYRVALDSAAAMAHDPR